MQQKLIVSAFSSIIAILLLVSCIVPLNMAYAQEPSQDFTIRVSTIYQNSKLVISEWGTGYSYQSLEELQNNTGTGLATSGIYSDTIPGETLETEELPYFGHSGMNFSF